MKYAPATLAYQIENLRATPEGTLESVRGPVPLIPDYGSGYPYGGGRMYGVFHARLDGGTRDVTLIRAGTHLYQQTGWTRGVETLASGLSSDPNARFPDQFVEVAGKIIWNNGIDQPRITDGYITLPLGYDMAPNAPSATGPGDTGHPVFRNQAGYSHPGKIGTVGNFFTANQGSLLKSTRFYYVQFEDIFGNRSPMSAASGAVVLRQELTQTSYWRNYNNFPDTTGVDLGLLTVNLDDLTKQLLVTDLPIGPEGTVARLLYASEATERAGTDPHFLVRIPDNTTTVFPDNVPDGALGAVPVDYIPLPRFQIMCAHNGSLVVLDGKNLRISDAGFPGSFQRKRYVPIGADGAEPTGVFSFGGRLYATTGSSIYVIDEDGLGLRARAVTEGMGMVGPNACAATELGVMCGLSENGFWSMTLDGEVTPISREEYPLFKTLNIAMLPHATAVWSPRDREFMCAVPRAGSFGNRLLMCWDGQGWRRRDYGISFEYLCVTRDWRRYVLGAGRSGDVGNVFVLDAEAMSYTPPTKTYTYRSAWIRMDPLGRKRFNADCVYVGIVESSRAYLTMRVWQNGSRDTQVAQDHPFEAVNPKTTEVLDALVLGTGKTRTPRLTWKKVDIRVKSCECFAFDITCDEPTYMHLAAFSFDGLITDEAGGRVSKQ